MNLLGKEVKHKMFGTGEVQEVKDKHIKVKFLDLDEIKTFSYPAAFECFLSIKDKKKQSEMKEILKKFKAEKLEEEKAIREKRIAEDDAARVLKLKEKNSHRKKVSNKKVKISNVALKCSFCDGEENENSSNVDDVFEDSMMLNTISQAKDIKLNSLAVLTVRESNTKDNDRLISAVFIVRNCHNADNSALCSIDADPVYRINLSLNEARQVKFWNYYFNPTNPARFNFGSGHFRYLTDEQSAQILQKICEVKKNTEEEKLALDFYKHYCILKNIDCDNLVEPNGALLRG